MWHIQAFARHIFTCYTLYSVVIPTGLCLGTYTYMSVPASVATGIDFCTQAFLGIYHTVSTFAILENRMYNDTSAGIYDC